ncbi:sigma factor-like helix-turn-helix DNA-binding protein [Streptomyces collinus]|uniref:sigma-70 region 4 domain-containing protein n=1 Tax=Streptomyces collinus TaxID=42684 RepID=UPI0037D4B4E5
MKGDGFAHLAGSAPLGRGAGLRDRKHRAVHNPGTGWRQCCLRTALSTLPPRMRQVVWLWALGTPPPQIARQLGISSSTVRVHLYQARQRLAADPLLASLADEAAC